MTFQISRMHSRVFALAAAAAIGVLGGCEGSPDTGARTTATGGVPSNTPTTRTTPSPTGFPSPTGSPSTKASGGLEQEASPTPTPGQSYWPMPTDSPTAQPTPTQPPLKSSVKVKPDTATLYIPDGTIPAASSSLRFSAEVTFADQSTSSAVTWKLSEPTWATVDAAGLVQITSSASPGLLILFAHDASDSRAYGFAQVDVRRP